MPRIPIYESQVNTPNPGPGYLQGAVQQSAEGPAMISGAIQGLGKGIDYAANVLKEKEDQDETLKALNEFSTFKIEQSKKMRDRQENSDRGAPGFVDTTLTEFKADSEALLSKYGNKKANQVLRQHLSSYSSSLADQAIGFEAQSRVKMKFEDAQTQVDNLAKIVRADPSQLKDSLAQGEQYIQTAGLPPAEQERVRKTMRDIVGSQAVRGVIDNDPWKAEKRIRAGEFDNALSAQNKDQLLNIAKAEQRHRTAEANQARALKLAETQSLAQNYTAQLAVNPNAPPPPDLSYDKLVSTLGEKAANQISTGLDQARIVGEDTNLLKTMLPEARKQYLQELTNAVGAKPDGAALAMNRLQHATAAVQNIEKEFADDPAQYGIKNNPTVAANAQQFFNAWGSADTTPERKQELWNQYKASQEGYQRSQGVTAPVLMSKPLAEKLASTIDQAKDPGEAANNLKALHAIMGNDAPAVLSQISKHIPPTMVFAADMENRPGSELVNAIRMHKEVDKTLTPDQKKAVGEKVMSQTEDVRGVLTQYTNGPALLAGLNDAVSTYAKYLVFKEGISEDAAAEKAFKHVWSDNFNVHKTFYVPKKEDTGALDVGADRIVKALDPAQLRRSTDYPYVANNSELENQQALASSLKSKYSIVTTEDRKGVYVLYGSGQHVMLKQEGKPNGVPMVLTWQQLRTAEPAKIPGTWEFPE